MIKAKNGKLVLKGRTLELINEYHEITIAMIKMLEDEGMPKENIKNFMIDTVENHFLTNEEIHKKLQKKIKELKENLFGDKEGGADNE